MADKQIRLVYPNLPSGTNYAADKYQPVPAWGAGGTSDYPTVRKIFKPSASDVTRTVFPLGSGSSYTLSATAANTSWTATGEDDMWNWTGAPMRFTGTTNPMTILLGHKGPLSANNAEQSWQRGVTGISMYHVNDANGDGYYGHYIDEMVLLYRKGSDTNNRWYGVDLIVGGNLKSDARRNYDNQTPFKTGSPRRGGSQGGFYVGVNTSSSIYDMINTGDYVFQAVYLNWGSYEANTQYQQRIELSKMRLIYDTYGSADNGGRICAGKLYPFQDSWNRSRPLKLT